MADSTALNSCSSCSMVNTSITWFFYDRSIRHTSFGIFWQIDLFVTFYPTTEQIQNTIVFGSNDIIISDNCCLNDKLLLPYSTKYNLANGACDLFDQERKVAHVYVNKNIEKIQTGINMFGVASMNYYHWMMDILSRIEYINHFPELKKIPLLVDNDALTKKTYKEALELVDNYHHPIIGIERDKAYQVEKLYYFSPCTFSGVYPNAEVLKERKYDPLTFAKNQESIKHFRSQTKEIMEDSKSPFGEKLFIDRGSSTSRLENEKEAMELATHYGFESFNPGEYSLEEQIKIISHAKVIIGDEGAAFTNAIWGNNCLFVIIEPSQWEDCLFSTIAHLSENKCINLDAKQKGSIENRKHIIDLEYLNSQFFTQLN